MGPSQSHADPFTGVAHQSQVTGTTGFPGLLNYSKFTGAVYAFCILIYYVITIPHLFAKWDKYCTIECFDILHSFSSFPVPYRAGSWLHEGPFTGRAHQSQLTGSTLFPG